MPPKVLKLILSNVTVAITTVLVVGFALAFLDIRYHIATSIPTPPPTLQPTIDTSNWQTYRNEELGFEMKYPGDWKYVEFVRPSRFRVEFLAKQNQFAATYPALEITNMGAHKEYDNVPHRTRFKVMNENPDALRIVFDEVKPIFASCYFYSQVLDTCNQILGTFRFLKK